MSKTKKFRELLNSKSHFFLMEAHNGLSAKIVEEAGFEAIWASGLSITASLGVRDNNEISYTQLLDVLEYMNDACDLPILVDGDTGYGNFNNACRLLTKLEQTGIAAVCIEDKKFPKTNSFLETKLDALADPVEFSGKIRAMKAVQTDPDFSVIARLESLIVGAGVADAIKRAEMYLDAGADALLVHSKLANPKDIFEFLGAFKRETPIFIVPTKYYSIPVKQLTKDPRISGIIWANHNVRSCVTAMQQVCAKIYKDNSIANVEGAIASVSEIFRLQKNEEYLEMEKEYMPSGSGFGAVVLAAGASETLDYSKPKSLLTIKGKTILDRQIEALNEIGISDISIVRGYKKEEIEYPELTIIDNDKWETTKVMYTLSLYSAKAKQPYFALYGDVFFKRYLLRDILGCIDDHADADLVLVCVKENYINNGFSLKLNNDFDDLFHAGNGVEVVAVCPDCPEPSSSGNGDTVYFSGLMMINNYSAIGELLKAEDIESLSCSGFLCRAIEQGLNIVSIVSSRDSIVDINSINDLLKVGEVYE
ncbi:MAG: phosphoenolpyruvate mutase [Oscillospiraceae bacterium]|nr:phosphoenolpyruvate mutase [Oscillospiraceae bacterium]